MKKKASEFYVLLHQGKWPDMLIKKLILLFLNAQKQVCTDDAMMLIKTAVSEIFNLKDHIFI